MPKKEFDVVGIGYRVTPATQEEMQKLEPLTAEIVRDEDNEQDENALKVVITEKPWEGFHIGFLRRQVAAEFAPLIDAGKLTLTHVLVSDFDLKAGKATAFLKVKRL